MAIQKAVKYDAKLRLALYGPSGSGKTFTALAIARDMSKKRVCVIDTERKSASKYADIYDFDVINLGNYHPKSYIEAIREVIQAKEYDVLIIDSVSHEWEGSHGALELVGGNFTNWTTVTPLHNQFIDAMLNADIHLIATMRAKEEHVMEKEEGRKAVIKKMGMEPIQRKGAQYEFDIVAALSMDNILSVEKTRCSALKDQIFTPGGEQAMVDILSVWLSGETSPEKPVPNPEGQNAPMTDQQLASLKKLCTHLEKPFPAEWSMISYADAKARIEQLSAEYKEKKDASASLFTQVYEQGKTKGTWTKDTFYATATAILGITVSAENRARLSAEHLKQLQDATEQEPLSLIS